MNRVWALIFIAATYASVAAIDAVSEPDFGCTTDSECAELCPEGTRDLPPDHPDYCDGGPGIIHIAVRG